MSIILLKKHRALFLVSYLCAVVAFGWLMQHHAPIWVYIAFISWAALGAWAGFAAADYRREAATVGPIVQSCACGGSSDQDTAW